MATPTPTTEPTHRVRPDVLAAAGLTGVVMLGRLLWQASDAGWFDTLAFH